MNTNEGGTPEDRNTKKGISDGDLLQANATVIAGTLIFLTIGSLTEGIVSTTSNLVVTALLIVVPFSLSSAVIIGSSASIKKCLSIRFL